MSQLDSTTRDTELALYLDAFMRRLHVSLHTKAPTFDTHQIGPAGAMIILTVGEFGQLQLHEIAAKVARNKSQITRLVQMLETKGLIARETLPDDGRASVISLTCEGHKVRKTHADAIATSINDLTGALSPSEKDQLRDLLKIALGR